MVLIGLTLVMLAAPPDLEGGLLKPELTCRQQCEKPTEPCLHACFTDPEKSHVKGAIEKCIVECDQPQRPCYQQCANELAKLKTDHGKQKATRVAKLKNRK